MRRFNLGPVGEADCPVFDGMMEYFQVRFNVKRNCFTPSHTGLAVFGMVVSSRSVCFGMALLSMLILQDWHKLTALDGMMECFQVCVVWSKSTLCMVQVTQCRGVAGTGHAGEALPMVPWLGLVTCWHPFANCHRMDPWHCARSGCLLLGGRPCAVAACSPQCRPCCTIACRRSIPAAPWAAQR